MAAKPRSTTKPHLQTPLITRLGAEVTISDTQWLECMLYAPMDILYVPTQSMATKFCNFFHNVMKIDKFKLATPTPITDTINAHQQWIWEKSINTQPSPIYMHVFLSWNAQNTAHKGNEKKYNSEEEFDQLFELYPTQMEADYGIRSDGTVLESHPLRVEISSDAPAQPSAVDVEDVGVSSYPYEDDGKSVLGKASVPSA